MLPSNLGMLLPWVTISLQAVPTSLLGDDRSHGRRLTSTTKATDLLKAAGMAGMQDTGNTQDTVKAVVMLLKPKIIRTTPRIIKANMLSLANQLKVFAL